jgi:hypothetical protein
MNPCSFLISLVGIPTKKGLFGALWHDLHHTRASSGPPRDAARLGRQVCVRSC